MCISKTCSSSALVCFHLWLKWLYIRDGRPSLYLDRQGSIGIEREKSHSGFSHVSIQSVSGTALTAV